MADIYRADHVGSLLRPESLKEARNMFYAGRVSADTLRESEDAAILEALAQQERIGVAVFTDGEFRRLGFQNDMQDAVEGFIDTGTPAVVRIWKGPGGEPQAQGSASSIALPGTRPNI